MVTEDEILALDGYDGSGVWRIQLDLSVLAIEAGRYERYFDKDDGCWYRDLLMPMSQARKICRLILASGGDEDIAAADKAFTGNAKLSKAWNDEKRRAGR